MMLRLSVLVALFLLGASIATAESPPRMMTDSSEYCNHLNGEMQKLRNHHRSAGPDAGSLADEGKRMCDNGQYRGGVARLRRALMLMKNAP